MEQIPVNKETLTIDEGYQIPESANVHIDRDHSHQHCFLPDLKMLADQTCIVGLSVTVELDSLFGVESLVNLSSLSISAYGGCSLQGLEFCRSLTHLSLASRGRSIESMIFLYDLPLVELDIGYTNILQIDQDLSFPFLKKLSVGSETLRRILAAGVSLPLLSEAVVTPSTDDDCERWDSHEGEVEDIEEIRELIRLYGFERSYARDERTCASIRVFLKF